MMGPSFELESDGDDGGDGDGQAASSLRIASWHTVDTVACWASLQADWVAGASPDMTPPMAW